MHDVEVEAHKESVERRKKPFAPKAGGSSEPPSAPSSTAVLDGTVDASTASDPQATPVLVIVEDVVVTALTSASEPLTNGNGSAATLTNGASTVSTSTPLAEDIVKSVTEGSEAQPPASQAVEVAAPDPKPATNDAPATDKPSSQQAVTTNGDGANGLGSVVANSAVEPAVGVASSGLPKPNLDGVSAVSVEQAASGPSSDSVAPVSNGAATGDSAPTSSASPAVAEATGTQLPGALPAAAGVDLVAGQPEGPGVPVVRRFFSFGYFVPRTTNCDFHYLESSRQEHHIRASTKWRRYIEWRTTGAESLCCC